MARRFNYTDFVGDKSNLDLFQEITEKKPKDMEYESYKEIS